MKRNTPPDAMMDEVLENLRAELGRLLGDMHRLIGEIGNDELVTLVGDIRETVHEPFLFVVVGEIKAGKSSFVNALLGEDVCPVDPAPCTDMIQLIVHGGQRSEADIAEHVRRITLPVDILQRIAIVDTPGTNTIMAHHEEITRRFIPNSGLVIFVFPAKNPHTRSAWDFLDYVGGEWRKKVIFVLQQADLATAEELRVSTEKVHEYADRRGFGESPVFAVSARIALRGEAGGGFDEVRAFIRETVTGGRHLRLKLQSSLETAEQILKKVYDALKEHEAQLSADRTLSEKLKKRIAEGREQIQRHTGLLIHRILDQYDRIGRETVEEFIEGLSLSGLYGRSIRSVWTRKAGIGKWIDGLQSQMEARLSAAFEDIVGSGSRQIVEALRRIAMDLKGDLDGAENRVHREAFAVVDLGSRREETISEVQEKIEKLVRTDYFLPARESNPESMTTTLVGGGILTLLGAMVMVTTHTAFFDITGGLLTGAGLLLSGGVLLLKKRRMVADLQQRIQESRGRIEEELENRIATVFDLALSDLEQSVTPFFDDLSRRTTRLESWMDSGRLLQQRLMDLSRRLLPPAGD